MDTENDSPLVSVVLPTHNRAHLLPRSIQSVLDQSFTDFEIIIVDDGSVDDTERVVKSFQDIRIRYLKLDENRGGSFARNVGIRASLGRYVAFQDSDDEWLQGKLEEQVTQMRLADVTVGTVYTAFERIYGLERVCVPTASTTNKNGWILKELLCHNFITTPAVLIKRECFDNCGFFDENLPRLQDWDLFIRISMSYKYLLIDKVYVLEYHQPDSISANWTFYMQSLNYILNKYQILFSSYNKITAAHYYYLSYINWKYKINGSWQEDLFEAFKRSPLKPRYFTSLLLGHKTTLNLMKLLKFNIISKIYEN